MMAPMSMAQTDSLALLNSGAPSDPNGTPGRNTLAELKKHYAGRLRADNYLCGLREDAALRKPKHWDCTVWRVDKPRYVLLPVDQLEYRVLPDGMVVSEVYSVDGSCEKALTAYFNFAAIYAKGEMEQVGHLGLPENTTGSITVSKKYKASKSLSFDLVSSMTLEMRDRRCRMWHTMQQDY